MSSPVKKLPDLKDRIGWLRIINSRDWTGIRNEDLVLLYDERHTGVDQRVVFGIHERLIEQTQRIIRRAIGWHLPNRGDDVAEAAEQIFHEAMQDPGSKHGQDLRAYFFRFVNFRALDERKRLIREVHRYPTLEANAKAINFPAMSDVESDTIRKMDLARAISAIADPKKREVIQMVVDSYTQEEIETATKRSTVTIRKWVKEFTESQARPTE